MRRFLAACMLVLLAGCGAVGRKAVQQAARYEALSADRRRIFQLALRESGEDPFGRVGENALDSDQGGICIASDRELKS